MKYHAYESYPHVFQPLQIKNLIYSNRLCSTTMSTVPTHIHLSSTNYGGIGIYDKSLGGVAMIGMMYHGTAGSSQYEANGANPFDKYNLDVLRESLSVVKQGGALAGFAIGIGNVYEQELYSPSGLPFARPYARKTNIITENIIYKLLDTVIEKAKRAVQFGFDLLILDMSNDNLAAHFMAPGFNQRLDEWGGSFENRFHLAKLLVENVRAAIGPNFVLELRISATLGVKETYPFEEMLRFLKSVENQIDIVNIVTGMDEYHDGNVKLCPPIFEPHLLNYERAKKIKETCDVFVNVSGAIMNIQEAEQVLADGVADLVLLGRSIVADPYMPKKAMEGREEDIVPCIRCNNCYHIATEHFNTCCSVNPRIYRENRVPLHLEVSKDVKQVLVIGAGPAGIKTALTAAEKGHHVTILEQGKEVGGALQVAAKGHLKQDLAAYYQYLQVQLRKSNIEIKLNTKATREIIMQHHPDVLIVAIGAKPIIPKITGINSETVISAADFIKRGLENAPQQISILGAGSIGCEIALELAQLGKRVTLIEKTNRLASNGNELYRTSLLQHLINHPNIQILIEQTCVEIKANECRIQNQNCEIRHVFHDELVLSVGYQPDINEIKEFYHIVPETRYVGDCKKVASVTEAITEGYFLGASI